MLMKNTTSKKFIEVHFNESVAKLEIALAGNNHQDKMDCIKTSLSYLYYLGKSGDEIVEKWNSIINSSSILPNDDTVIRNVYKNYILKNYRKEVPPCL